MLGHLDCLAAARKLYFHQFKNNNFIGDIYGFGESPESLIVERWLAPLVRILFLYLKNNDPHLRQIYLGERINRPFCFGASLLDKKNYFEDIVQKDIEVLLTVAYDLNQADKNELINIHELLKNVSSVCEVNVTTIGDCLMTQTNTILNSIALQKKLGVNIHELYIGAWGDRDSFDFSPGETFSESHTINIVAISFFTYWGIPTYRNLMKLLWERKVTTDEADVFLSVIIEYIQNYIEKLIQKSNSIIFLHNTSGLPWLASDYLNFFPWFAEGAGDKAGIEVFINRINMAVDDIIKKNIFLFLVDEREIVSDYGAPFFSKDLLLDDTQIHSMDPIFHYNKMGFYLAERYARMIARLRLLNGKKVLFVDFDNTLWSGVMAEGYVDHYINKQALVSAIAKTGIILVALSKNDELNIRWSQIAIKKSDFSILKINWNNKVENILSAVEELNLSLDSCIVIDDSDQELGLIQAHIPQILCLNSILEESWVLLDYLLKWQSRSTTEARKRNQYYQQNQSRQEYVSTISNKIRDENKLFHPLKITAFARDALVDDVDRIMELLARTNQFNCSGKSYTRDELVDFCERLNWIIRVFCMEDIFGDMGIVGVVIVEVYAKEKHQIIHNFIMSCRAMGYGMENYMLADIVNHSEAKKHIGIFNQTSKNSPAQNLYRNAGFEQHSEDGYWYLHKKESDELLVSPAWINNKLQISKP